MGLLKHVLLPFFAVLNTFIAYQLIVNESIDDVLEPSAPFGRDTAAMPPTLLELHFLHALGGTSAAFAVAQLGAIFSHCALYRAMAVFMQIVFAAVDVYSCIRLERQVPTILYVVIGLGAIGLMVQSMEPGIFAKDKTKIEDGKKQQ